MDAPGKGARLRRQPTAAGRALLAQLDGLQQSLDIVTPYLVPTRHFYRTLRRMIRRGCSARVLTNSLAATDMPLAYAGFRSRCARLLKTGLSLFELRPDAGRCLHAKLALFDRRSLLVGSLNLDPRSFYLNTEIALLLEGASLVAEVEAWLEQQLIAQQAWAVTLGEEGISWAGSAIEPETSAWRRALIRLAGWLPVHHLL
jgi:putative cardiolipin synthase